jgi:hypothetical protein
MPLADLLRRVPQAGSSWARRLPASPDELRGPERGVVVLPRHLCPPGLREFDVKDPGDRRNLYGIVLTRGQRNDMARFVNARLLREDWPALSGSLDPKIRRGCARWLKRAR